MLSPSICGTLWDLTYPISHEFLTSTQTSNNSTNICVLGIVLNTMDTETKISICQ